MSASRLAGMLAAPGRHVSPFFVLGDPAPGLSVDLAVRAVELGADMLELGFPFSDPCADGPAIQAANLRARRGGTGTARALTLLASIHASCPRTPLNLLVYGNLVHARGLQRFCADARAAGASSLLVPDIPFEEGAALHEACRAAGLGQVQLAGPGSTDERLARLGKRADAFLYLVAHQGVTGARAGGEARLASLVRRVTGAVDLPVCVGFGLSQPAQLRRVFAAGARIAVVGSHLADRIAEGGSAKEQLGRLAATLQPLMASTEDTPCS